MIPHTLQILNGLKILHVTNPTTKNSWLEKAVSDFNGISLAIREEHGKQEGLKRLQLEVFDAVLVSVTPYTDALDFITGSRTSGVMVPMLILGRKTEANQLTLCCERGGDGWISLELSSVSDLLWSVALAVQNYRNAELQNHHLLLADQEFTECCGFLEQLRTFVGKLASEDEKSEELKAEYLALLKSFIPATAEKTGEMTRTFARKLVEQKTSVSELLTLHANALETILAAPGRKSPFHLTNRANLLCIELMAILMKENSAENMTSFASTEAFVTFPSYGKPEEK